MINNKLFTIIELIIVIAILAALASLLSPSLKSAIQTARQNECANQMKSIHLGMELYQGDHKAYPGIWYQGSHWGNWVKSIWSYTGLDLDEYQWNGYSHRRGTKKNLFHCPVTYEAVIPSVGWAQYSEPDRESSYAYNARPIWTNLPSLFWQEKWRTPIQTEWFDQPANTALLIESQHHVITSLTQYSPNVIEPHFMKRNMLSWDGHIETLSHDEVTTDFNDTFWTGQ